MSRAQGHGSCFDVSAVRRLTPVPAKSVEILLLESPEAFTDALLARPPSADQNHLIARDKSETLRRFALRAIHRLRRLLATPEASRVRPSGPACRDSCSCPCPCCRC